MHGGDKLFVSAEVAAYLGRLQVLGVSQRTVQMERDIWILIQSVSPKEAATWIADKSDAIVDPEFRAIYLEYDTAFGRCTDDPRLNALGIMCRTSLVMHVALGRPYAPDHEHVCVAPPLLRREFFAFVVSR